MRKNRINIIIFFLSILLSVTAYSKNTTIRDSLLILIESESHDTSKVLLYEDLIRYYLSTNVDSALYFASTGLFIAEKSNYNFGTGKMYQLLGHSMVVSDNLEMAKKHYLDALKYYRLSGHVVSQSSVHLVLGNVFFVQNNYPEALTQYMAGEKIADSLNIVTLLPDFYNNLAGVYLNLKEYEQSLKYYTNALKLSDLNGNIETAVSIRNNMAQNYVKLRDFTKAKTQTELAFKLADKIPSNESYKVHILHTEGEIEVLQKNYREALIIYRKALNIINEMGPGYLGPKSVDLAICHLNIGICYFEFGKFSMAEENLIDGYNIAKESGLIAIQRDAAQYLSKVYDARAEFKNEIKYLKIFKLLSDSISNENTTKQITQLKMQFEFDKTMREREVEQARKEMLQKKKEVTLYVIIAGVLVGLLIFLLLYLLQKNKSKRIYLERQNLKLDLDNRNKELTTNVMYLLKKNEFIDSISNKLKKTKLYFKPENRTFVDNIIKELESSSSKDTWEEFEVRFQNVHSKFYEKLNEMYPGLSPNELKLCAFLRLNMTTKEIASITYQSPKSINVARYRLRKKLGLDDHANLINSLSQL